MLQTKAEMTHAVTETELADVILPEKTGKDMDELTGSLKRS